MKTKLLLLVLLFSTPLSFSQVIWTGGGGTPDWNTSDNWSSNMVPTNLDDVEIPGGFTVTINGGASCKSLVLKGSAILNVDTASGFFSSQPSFFETGSTVNWANGSITCSLLVNQSTMNLTSSEDKVFGTSTLVNNNGTINIIGSGDLFLQGGTVLNNQIDGTIDMRADGGHIDAGAGGPIPVLNNANLIRRSTSTGATQINVALNNNGGIIQVDSGSLSLTSFRDKNLTGGTYVVSQGAVLNWDTTITVSGFLMGTIEGDLNWNIAVAVPVSATFNFTGGGNFNWTGGVLNGGGVLTNQSILNLTGTGAHSILESTTLNTTGTINITDTGDLTIGSGSVVNNQASGVIDMQADGGNIGNFGVLNNTGLIQRTTTTGEAQIGIELNNNDGIIEVESGTLLFYQNTGIGDKNLTDGTYNVSSGAVLDWVSSMTLSGDISGVIDGTLNWDNFSSNTVSVPVSATLNFTGSGNVNWVNGTLNGGGTLTNQSTLNLITTGAKIIEGDTTLNNYGTINIIGAYNLFINQSIVNNLNSGVIDLQANNGNITQSGGTSGILNNTGLIQRTTTTGIARIFVELNNNNGIIQVENGTLSFDGTIGKNLTDGTYNVSSGAALDWDSLIVPSGVLSGTIDGALNWNDTVSVPGTAAFNFTGSGNVNWVSSILNGGGVLTNQSTLNLITTNNKSILEDTTLNNTGIINIVDAGDLFITQGIVNNQGSGVIDLQVNNGNITMSGGTSNILNNIGLIKRTTATGAAVIHAELNNNGGIIQVESGILLFQTVVKNLTGGTYNVSPGAELRWNDPIALSGILSGVIDGALNWNNTVSVPGSATLNFTGSGNVNWANGTLNGGGVLTNQSTLNLTTGNNKSILEDTTLNNSGIINIVDTGDLFITQGIVNNQGSGVIDLQANLGSITRSGGTSNILNNVGLLKRTTTAGIARIFVELNNSGTIEVETGELEIANSLPFTNEVNGIIKGVGVFDLPLVANYTNDGIFAPGLSPGTLSVQGDYTSTTNSFLDIELNGLVQGTEYDVLAIIGDADFNGDIQITLGFDADVNDEFIVATTTNTINTCNLPATTTSSFGGFNYEFDVLCRNNNELVLTVTNETLDLEYFDEEMASIKLFPNPANDLVYITDENITSVEVFDINSRRVLAAKSNTFSVKHLSNGIYVVKILGEDNRIMTKRLIKY